MKRVYINIYIYIYIYTHTRTVCINEDVHLCRLLSQLPTAGGRACKLEQSPKSVPQILSHVLNPCVHVQEAAPCKGLAEAKLW